MSRKNTQPIKGKVFPNIFSSLVILMYGFVTVVTPNMNTFDSNGPKFFTLAVLNLLVFVFFFFVSDERKKKTGLFSFFNTSVAVVYAVMILMALLSFVKAVNTNESLLHFAKMFTTFIAVWMVCLLVSRDKKVVVPLAIGMSLLLILDSIDTFKGLHDIVIAGKGNINSIKSSYSNKNILTSAIFIKIPFAIWLFYFQKNWMKYVGAVALFLAFIATFFLSARAFYLGLIIISLLLFLYAIHGFLKTKNRTNLNKFAAYFLILVLAFGVFAFVQQTMYPEKIKESRGVAQRLSTITDADNGSNNLRLTAWGHSLKMIKKDPLLGVGIGNWKIRVLEYENSYSPSYIYMYKNHNDFLETTAEYGVLGGIAFIAIFFFVFFYFIKVLRRNDSWDEHVYFFLPALGLVAYSFDAFFNFPQDRPEIQSLFALYIGISAALALLEWEGDSHLKAISFNGKGRVLKILPIVVGMLLLGSSYLLRENVKSLKLQRIVKQELNSGKLKSKSERFLNGFPSIPDITILEEPIAVQKARYLINEKRYKEARSILLVDESNPYDGRKEYFIAMSFYDEQQYDSAMFYAQKALKLKPYFYNTNTIVAAIYEKRKEYNKSIETWRNYLKGVKNKSQAWTVPAGLLERQGRLQEAKALIDSAYSELPNDKKITALRNRINKKISLGADFELYEQGVQYYGAQQYQKALPLFSKFIEKSPKEAKAYELRAICYYQERLFQKCLDDILKEESLGARLNANVINIKGAAYLMLGDKKKAKQFFKEAMDMGDKDARNNYMKNFGVAAPK